MKTRNLILSLVLAAITAAAGCPVTPSGGLGSDIPASSGIGSGGGSTTEPSSTAPAGTPVTAGSGSGASSATELPGCLEPADADAWRLRVLQLTNQQRAALGLPPLKRNATLEDQANRYACEMIYYDFFDHVNPTTGSTLDVRAAEFGYQYLKIGENLAAGQRSPEDVVEDWMGSPGHRENIVDPEFTEIGIGIRQGGQHEYYWVQEFGSPFP